MPRNVIGFISSPLTPLSSTLARPERSLALLPLGWSSGGRLELFGDQVSIAGYVHANGQGGGCGFSDAGGGRRGGGGAGGGAEESELESSSVPAAEEAPSWAATASFTNFDMRSSMDT